MRKTPSTHPSPAAHPITQRVLLHYSSSMIRAVLRAFARFLVLPSLFIAGSISIHAQDASPGHQRVQQIALSKGWNAVYLEVQPSNSAPAAVFSGLPVDKVATLFKAPVSNQFVSDATVNLSKGQGWGVWYAAGSPEAFLKSLDTILGSRAYLIHTTAACQWRATGDALPTSVEWRADAYNFVGFPIASNGGPTFAQFFAGSKAHKDQAIYRLADGKWKKVLQASAETMKSGEAFWAYCKGPSDYQGPLRVETETHNGLIIGASGSQVVLRNETPYPLSPTIEHFAATGPALPLSVMIRSLGDPSAPVRALPAEMPAGPWMQALPPLETGKSMAIPFECRARAMSQPRQTSLLKITTDIGTESWVPVVGLRGDLAE